LLGICVSIITGWLNTSGQLKRSFSSFSSIPLISFFNFIEFLYNIITMIKNTYLCWYLRIFWKSNLVHHYVPIQFLIRPSRPRCRPIQHLI
jgi:hypothetical protein